MLGVKVKRMTEVISKENHLGKQLNFHHIV